MTQRIIIDPPPVPTCQDSCPAQCASVFDRVSVSYLIRGGTRVMWDIIPEFPDPQPWTFQLQVGKTGNNAADDWENVGSPAENMFYAIDGDQRVYGMTNFTHYRVKLVTDAATYYSEPVDGTGIFSPHDWRIAREIIRQERLRHRFVSQEGYLLKRRISGAKCTLCLEYQTDEVLDPHCPQCFGTGFQCGYYYPMPCVWVDFSNVTARQALDATRGTTKDIFTQGRMLMVPLLESNDIWVSKQTDDRYYLQTIRSVADLRGIPLLVSVDLRLAPFTDVAYDIQIPEQIAATEDP